MNKLRLTLTCLFLLGALVGAGLPAHAEVMACYVDTPAFDLFRNNSCFAAGSARETTAVFKVNGVSDPSTSTIAWSDPNCSGFGYCLVPIRWYQSVTVSATITDALGQQTTVSATAHYEGLL